MQNFISRWKRKRRPEVYLRAHSEDEPAVSLILSSIELLSPKTARDVAEMTYGRALTDTEWQRLANDGSGHGTLSSDS
jgi:hypothetical protein